MNRIDLLFKEKRQNILSVYFTAGYPLLNDTVTIIETLEKTGVDLIEIGVPFSDPLADGPVIQKSSEKALKNGMSLKVLFNQLENIRKSVKVPLILMGYLNPVMQYSISRFCEDAQSTGIDGIILPDLPLDVYLTEYKQLFEKNKIYYIPLITPQTSEQRIKKIDESTSGFIYLVSSSTTTGTKEISDITLKSMYEKIRNLKLKNPQLTGFGIKDKESFRKVCQYTSGGIIGTAFIDVLSGNKNLEEAIVSFITQLR
jgi:tryptophan synthase alpha chain